MARPLKTRPKIVHKKLGRYKIYGRHHGDGLIWIDPRLRPKSYFITLIHELLHEFFPEASEARVRRIGYKMSRVLWGHNVRIVKQ